METTQPQGRNPPPDLAESCGFLDCYDVMYDMSLPLTAHGALGNSVEVTLRIYPCVVLYRCSMTFR